jgi:hypothetical protein
MTIRLESYIIFLMPIVQRVKAGDYSIWEGKSRSGSQSSFTCVQTLAYIFLTEEETVSVPFMHNMPFSVGFYYYIKRKRTVCIEILNLGLKRDLRNPSLYASKRALTSTSTFSFLITPMPLSDDIKCSHHTHASIG